MIGNLSPEDRVMSGLPEFFEQTSNESYVRHDYKLCYTTGKIEVYSDYEDLRNAWWNIPDILRSHCEVLDKKNKKQKSKGFN